MMLLMMMLNDDDDDDCDKGDRKLSHRKQAVRLLHNIEMQGFILKPFSADRPVSTDFHGPQNLASRN